MCSYMHCYQKVERDQEKSVFSSAHFILPIINTIGI